MYCSVLKNSIVFSGGLSENGPHRFTDLNTYMVTREGHCWKRLGDMTILKEVYHREDRL